MSQAGADPKVTVFMPVHNREAFVGASIKSILDQSYEDFELLVVDDGSTDQSAEVVASLDDPRIRLVHNESNLGIPRTRNRGLDLARGEYIALLDSDDLAYPQRLALQVGFLDRNPEVAAVGSWAHRISRSGKARSSIERPTLPRNIHARILFVSCLKNPTVMARTDVLREFRYREDFRFCQDIELWSRVSSKYLLANLPRYLIQYRLGGDSHQDDSLAVRLKTQVARAQLQSLGVDPHESDLMGHHQLRNLNRFKPDAAFIDWSEEWLLKLIATNAKNRCYPEPEFTVAAAERWYRLGLAAGPVAFASRFFASPTLRRTLPDLSKGLAAVGANLATAKLVGRTQPRARAK
jgi:glycosyltransferase involved in cell wall biosynthesis